MPEEIKFNEISRDEYLKHLPLAKNTTFYNFPERLDFIKKRNRNISLYSIVKDRVVSGLLFYQKIPARSGAFVYFQHSPILIDESLAHSVDFWKSLHIFAKEIGKKEGAVYVRLTPRILTSDEVLGNIISAGFTKAPVQEVDACVTRIIKLENFTVKQLRDDAKHALTKAQEAELTVDFNTDEASTESFLAIYKAMVEKKQIDSVPLDYLRDELKSYLTSGKLLITKIHDKSGKLFSASTTIIYKKRAWYYWAATTPQGKEIGSATLMLYSLAEKLRKEGYVELDLWGGAVSKTLYDKHIQHPWTKLDEFKRGFGSELVEFLPAVDVAINPAVYIASTFYQRALMQKRGYPYIKLKQ